MSTWLESGRSAIQEALAAAFDRIEENARTELQERDRKDKGLLGELEQLKTRAAEVDRLQHENESLKEKIQQLQKAQKDGGSKSTKNRQILGELSPNKPLNPGLAISEAHDVDTILDLQKRYNKLAAKYKALGQSRDECRSKLRQRIEEIDRWAECVDSRDKLIGNLRKKLALAQGRLVANGCSETRPNETENGESVDDEPLDVAAPVPKRLSPHSSLGQPMGAGPHTTASSTALIRACSEPGLRPVAPSHLAEDILKESTDEDGRVDDGIELPRLPEPRNDEPMVAIKVELSSDGPVFVSERSVRKRKHDREEDPNDKRLQRIKSEHSSSGPECVGETHDFAPTESLDFEEEAHIPTPRKRRDVSHDRLQDQDTDTGRTTEPGLPDNMRRRTTMAPAVAGAPLASAQGPGLSPSTYNYSTLLKAPGRQSRPSTPRDQQPYKSRNAFRLDMGVRDLAEDGDADSDTVQRPVVRSLLGALLDSPSVRTPTPIIRPGFSGANFPRPILADDYENAMKVPAPRELPHGKKYRAKEALAANTAQQSTVSSLSPKTAAARERPPKKPSILRDDMPRGRSTDMEKTPIRNKPMDKLRPEDFKPNPRYNDGLTYVYDEVNRGMTLAERAALPGCTDPKCCGKTFRAFAEAERLAIGPSVFTRSEDIRLLEEYLGDDAYKLGTMTREEKEETWLQAKTWELANKFGRHRQRYTRMPSPPGFWTVELPNTQERAEERRQADEIRKALVHERYREAMRPGGMWLFRDEDGR